MAASARIVVFWFMIPCSLEGGGTNGTSMTSRLRGDSLNSVTQRMKNTAFARTFHVRLTPISQRGLQLSLRAIG
jgi:hypothetical protein